MNEQPIKQKVYKRWWFWVILLSVLVLAGTATAILFRGSGEQGQKSIVGDLHQAVPRESRKEAKLKSLGFNLDYYNQATNKAGEIEFVKFKPPYDKVFTDYGQVLPAQYSAEGKESKNVHPSILLPAGTKLLSPIDGIVSSVTSLYSGDFSIQISADGKQSGLTFGLEHIKNPTVKAGDEVKAGNPIAEVTDFTSEHHPGYGYFDLAVFSSTKDGKPQHHCPFLYLDDSIKDEVFSKIRALYTSWERFTGDDKMYDENAYTVPGCISLDPIDG